ncbi:hypothetical protein QJS04_geneDACA022073 [Acorus gramineus]|uniref:Uncharacterized protein n=1 Tax=Acorus gramineus TaxID=55184 RepID=A0AAV9A362_ACOGR|nr:hypothetical protein QJS04_geneDACA022073 [Acorus gramineus]
MGGGGRVMEVVGKKEKVVHLFLLGALGFLTARSWAQQKEIESLEAEKLSLMERNKAMKKSMWEWRRQLYREASKSSTSPSSSHDSFKIPLHRLQAIFGDDVSPDADSGAVDKDSPVLTKKFVI